MKAEVPPPLDKPFCPACEKEYSPGTRFCPGDGTRLITRSEDSMTGKVIDERYQILYRLGEGGMGAVYKARHIATGKTVAVKTISPRLTDSPASVARFQREVKIQANLEHPNVVTVIDFARSSEGDFYFVMGFAEGKPLSRLILEKGKLPVEEFMEIAGQICDGLEYAHRMGVVHRDLKGDNIVLTRAGHQRVAKILDFGIAKALEEGLDITRDSASLTQEGRILGTPAYMSPEQARGETGGIDRRSDIYSLGVIFYEMLSGRLPFRSDTPWGYLHKHVSEAPPPLREINPSVPPHIERAVMRCLEKDRDRRFSSALEVKLHLEEQIPSAPVPADASVPAAPPRPPRRRIFPAVAGGAGAALLLVLLVSRRPSPPPADGTAAVGVLTSEPAAGAPAAPGVSRRESKKREKHPAPLVAAVSPPEPEAAKTEPAAAPPPSSALTGTWRYTYREGGREGYLQFILLEGGAGRAEGEEIDGTWWAEKVGWRYDGGLLTVRHPDREESYRVLAADGGILTLEGVVGEDAGERFAMAAFAGEKAAAPLAESRLAGTWKETWDEGGGQGYNVYTFLDGGRGSEKGRSPSESWSDSFRWSLQGDILTLDMDGDVSRFRVRRLTADTLDLEGLSADVEGEGARYRRQPGE